MSAALPSRAPLTLADAAARWAYSDDDLRRLVRSGALVASRIGPQRVLILADDADKFERHAIKREPLDGDVVYFVEARLSKLIKIGRTSNTEHRFRGLQTTCAEPIALLALCPGAEREFAFHRRFHKERMHGEWFKPSRRLRALTDELRDTFGLPEWAL